MPNWTRLPPSIQTKHLKSRNTDSSQKWQSFVRDGGFKFRFEDETVYIQTLAGWGTAQQPIFWCLPLQGEDGHFRADAEANLTRGTFGSDLPGIKEMLAADPSMRRPPENLEEHQKHLLLCPELDALGAITTDSPHLELHRLLTSEGFLKRQQVLSFLTNLARGTKPSEIQLGSAGHEPFVVSGMLESGPGGIVGPLLAARMQPLGVILSTRCFAQVAVLPRHGALLRPFRILHLGLVAGSFSVLGSGDAVYDVEKQARISEGAAKEALDALIEAANSAVMHLTDPARWTDSGGVFDPEIRWVAWSSVLAGLAAISSVSEHWSDGDEGLWAAFRALGILQGLWIGTRGQQAIRFEELLNPDRFRSDVLKNLPQGAIKDWGEVVLKSYKRMLDSVFQAGSPQESARQLVEVRNLMHGVGASNSKYRKFTDRLEVLRRLGPSGKGSLHTVMDIATLWWTAAICSPATHLNLGKAPWE